ncbi:hypothetical protein KDK95_12990 [Actinospica sp. MGRD01-02]|uniref:Ricin B lectin domain-containing protein n=1 Tax=Actinospica acidithermotolerans TaxID=2828514 RepID=A0A941E906_9ACTN|nr:hypothetical protein [Actinospica acidithermotolerans]MBR7827226.1 hypothetical protein [Actinospica acidithermotolerans]
MLSFSGTRRFTRLPLRAFLIAALAFALSCAALDTTAPRQNTAAPRISVAQLCDQSVTAVAAAYRTRAESTSTGADVQPAAYTSTTRQTNTLNAARRQASANCERRLNALQTGWSYLSARAVEIAVDAVVTILAATTICYFAPAYCGWGVRFASFAGGFLGSMAFQYLTDGTLNWKSVGYAFLDAAVSMLSFSGLDKLSESYIEKGVTSTFRQAGGAVASVANRIGGLGSGFISYIQNAADWINTNVLVAAGWAGPVPVAYHGGASIVPAAVATKSATDVEIRAVADNWSSDTGIDHQDLHSGSGTSEYYTWTITKLGGTNSDGAIGYAISQGNQCLTPSGGNYSKVNLAACDWSRNSSQWWYFDGSEIMSTNGECLAEGQDGNRWLSNCDGLNYVVNANSGANDDQFLVTPSTHGTPYHDTVAAETADWKTYATD